MANFRYSHLFTTKTGDAAITAAASKLNEAEIALAIADGEEKILFKNVIDEVVTVPTDEEVDTKLANKTDYQVDGTNGKSLMFNEADASGGGAKFERTDGTWSFVGVNDGSENGIAGQIYTVKKNASNKFEGTRIDLSLGGMYYTKGDASAAERMVGANEIAVKGDIPAVDGYFDGVEYDSSAKTINFFNGISQKASIDASDFVVDGMIDSVELVEMSGDTFLHIVFNTDAGKEDVYLNIGDIFNADNYYTKAEVDALIDAEEARAKAAEEALGKKGIKSVAVDENASITITLNDDTTIVATEAEEITLSGGEF